MTRRQVMLYPCDAGTEDGTGFSLNNPDTKPAGDRQEHQGGGPVRRRDAGDGHVHLRAAESADEPGAHLFPVSPEHGMSRPFRWANERWCWSGPAVGRTPRRVCSASRPEVRSTDGPNRRRWRQPPDASTSRASNRRRPTPSGCARNRQTARPRWEAPAGPTGTRRNGSAAKPTSRRSAPARFGLPASGQSGDCGRNSPLAGAPSPESI